jgi:two-component system sensor histidine kinase UhpB
LSETLDNLVKDWQRRNPAMQLTLNQQLTTDLGPSVTLAIYRVVQEGLINALRHAQASRVEINLNSDSQRILVTIADDGVGLPADWSRPGHFGLRGLADRVEHLGGALTITNQQPRGACLRAEIPLTVTA